MSKRNDETGNKYGKLTVIAFAYTRNNRAYWHCKCECGNECDIMGKYLRNGDTKSCGCLQRDAYIYAAKANIKRNRTLEDSVYVHVFFNNSSAEMICDKKSWKKAKDITWHVTEEGRVRGAVDNRLVLFHDFILDFTPNNEYMVDHKNRNPLDNRLDNLRIVKRQINAQNLTNKRKNNTSGCVGVSKCGNKWMAYICNDTLGYFEKYDDAVTARKEAEKIRFKNIKYEYIENINEDIYADYECIDIEKGIIRKISTGEIIEERVTDA